MANSKGKKKTSTKHTILKEILETLHFHLFESGGEMAKGSGRPVFTNRPGCLTPEYYNKIRSERLAKQRELENRH